MYKSGVSDMLGPPICSCWITRDLVKCRGCGEILAAKDVFLLDANFQMSVSGQERSQPPVSRVETREMLLRAKPPGETVGRTDAGACASWISTWLRPAKGLNTIVILHAFVASLSVPKPFLRPRRRPERLSGRLVPPHSHH